MASPGRLESTRDGPVLILTVSNPSARNALDPGMFQDGAAALEALDADVGAIVIRGEGDHFCGGGNLARLRENQSKPPSVPAQSVSAFHRLILAIRNCPRPVIAAVEGHAAGGGCSLALSADLIVASEAAKFTMAYVKVGLSPDGGGTAFLGELLPRQLAFEMLVEGNSMSADRLFRAGVINRICSPGESSGVALAWATKLSKGARRAQSAAKRLLDCARFNALQTQLELERGGLLERLYDAESIEGIAAFLEKRKPEFGRQ